MNQSRKDLLRPSYRTTSLRKVCSQLLLRWIIPLRLSLRILRPSCWVATWLLLRAGIMVQCLAASAGPAPCAVVAAVANQPFRLPAFPRAHPHFDTGHVASTRLTSAGEAASRCTPSGVPAPSASTIRCVPLPLFVFPTSAPPFCAEAHAVDAALVPAPCCWSESWARNTRHRLRRTALAAHALGGGGPHSWSHIAPAIRSRERQSTQSTAASKHVRSSSGAARRFESACAEANAV